jgi:hypothetical protein
MMPDITEKETLGKILKWILFSVCLVTIFFALFHFAYFNAMADFYTSAAENITAEGCPYCNDMAYYMCWNYNRYIRQELGPESMPFQGELTRKYNAICNEIINYGIKTVVV